MYPTSISIAEATDLSSRDRQDARLKGVGVRDAKDSEDVLRLVQER